MAILVTNEDIRRARAFLQGKGIPSGAISPRKFAEAAAEQGKSMSEALKMYATLLMGTQGQGPAPIATRIAEKEAEAA